MILLEVDISKQGFRSSSLSRMRYMVLNILKIQHSYDSINFSRVFLPGPGFLLLSLREGLIEPIVVHRKGRRYEIIAGKRRFRAVRDFMEMKTIPAQIVKATDLQACRMSAAENLQRQDLTRRLR